MIVEVPCDYFEAIKATTLIAENGKPSYLRLEREPSVAITSLLSPFEIGVAYAL